MTREEVIRIATGLRTDFKCESETMVDFCNTIIKLVGQEPCGDLISRQAAIDAVGLCRVPSHIKARIAKLPPVTPNQKIGHWIDTDEGFSPCECSECEAVEFKKSKYCPNCGAKMQEVKG